MTQRLVTRRGIIGAAPALVVLTGVAAHADEVAGLDPKLRVLSRFIGAWRGTGGG